MWKVISKSPRKSLWTKNADDFFSMSNSRLLKRDRDWANLFCYQDKLINTAGHCYIQLEKVVHIKQIHFLQVQETKFMMKSSLIYEWSNKSFFWMVFRKVPKMKNSEKKCFSQYRKIGDNKYDVYFKYVTRTKTKNTKGSILSTFYEQLLHS